MTERGPIQLNKLTRIRPGERSKHGHHIHGTIKVGEKTIRGRITPIPEGTSAQEELRELRSQGINAHLVELGNDEHRILQEETPRVRLPRKNGQGPSQV